MDSLASNRPPDVTQEQEKDVAAKHDETPIYFGKRPVDSGMVRMVSGISLVLLFFLVALLTQPSSVFIRFPQRFQSVPTIEVHSAQDLLKQLVANDLWEVQAYSEVPAVLVRQFPGDMPTLDAPTQKKAFLHVLLPAAMIALSEVQEERINFEKILAKLSQPFHRLDLNRKAEDSSHLAGLSQNELFFLRNLCHKYRTCEVADLRRRINPVPVSLIMAQGALESSWGGSRFALEKNNLFGVLRWNMEGREPDGLEDGKAYYGKSYASLLDSVRGYILMINRAPAYKELRQLREDTMDPLVLAKGLHLYSNRGSNYIADVAQLITSNDLQDYDQCVLANKTGLQSRVRFASLENLR
ncbi:glucosaminidase domain-containing protein [Thiovibrio frasassiensis]|uniref:Glucosaminidase domain-containing protein n=1 Tax=Thiovibrio frasassiensis TaxID=2984131 RepID=A0A9X4MKX0_9BACT|nr:glucosaminidase domain-containing protein [Thiovibrio frasassiensis]MDG4476689.1 glucosaminidase domain-containing protein [Thiovibrio frasassiensis]